MKLSPRRGGCGENVYLSREVVVVTIHRGAVSGCLIDVAELARGARTGIGSGRPLTDELLRTQIDVML